VTRTSVVQYVNLGASGLKVSRIALGMMTYGSPQWRPWVLDEAAAKPIVRRAVELGINLFDTADMYSAGVSEEITGRLLKELLPRDEVVIATKLFHPVDLAFKGGNYPGTKAPQRPNLSGLSRKRIFAAADASLKRLGVDTIDLYQIHRFDPATPVEEAMEALTTWCAAARCATSAPQACGHGNSPRCRTRPSGVAGRASYRCRTITTSSIAKKSAR